MAGSLDRVARRLRAKILLTSLALSFLGVAASLAKGDTPPSAKPTPQQLDFFERQVRPLLITHCYKCHSNEAKELGGDLLLDTRDGVRRGGQSGAVIVPGDPEASRLIRAVRYTDSLLQMPPEKRLAAREVEVLVEWVRQGAPDPRDDASGAPSVTKKSEHAQSASTGQREWWSFQPLSDPPIPRVSKADEQWPLNNVDRFVLAGLESQGFRPAPPADRLTLIRRATFDLTGMPPTPDEIDAFVADPRADAFERVVNRLLASPRYGERWGRHWLDVVRYADTSGCNGDFPVVDAYRYRNYVIQSFNGDKPYNQFVREQIAGDLLPAGSDEERYERLIATGYLAISRRFSSLGEEFHLTLDDTVDNVGKAFLGLSISCARCHDHKFDPIPQKDYYALYGIFQSTTYAFPGTEIYRHTQDFAPLVPADRLQSELLSYLKQMSELDRNIFVTYSEMAEQDTGPQKERLKSKWKEMQKQRDELLKKLPDYPRAYSAAEGNAVNARIHIKGDPKKLGDPVPRGSLQLLGGQRIPDGEAGSGRRELADWLTDPANPLTARVLVNRVWLHHFGRGLVRTPDDFGTRGERPVHGALLDYLTRRFLAEGWSLKSLHRQMMLSRTYQMATTVSGDALERDPDNKWLSTFNPRRLDAEEIRDAMLVISGSLDESMGGRHPFPPEVEWRYTQHKPFVDDFPTNRRTVYVMQQRIRQQPYLAVFDGADTNVVTGSRKISTVAPQALFMLNSEFAHQQASTFAARLIGETQADTERVVRAYRLALGRPPVEAEVREATEYMRQIKLPLEVAGVSESDRERATWASYLRVLLSGNEFLFVD